MVQKVVKQGLHHEAGIGDQGCLRPGPAIHHTAIQFSRACKDGADWGSQVMSHRGQISRSAHSFGFCVFLSEFSIKANALLLSAGHRQALPTDQAIDGKDHYSCGHCGHESGRCIKPDHEKRGRSQKEKGGRHCAKQHARRRGGIDGGIEDRGAEHDRGSQATHGPTRHPKRDGWSAIERGIAGQGQAAKQGSPTAQGSGRLFIDRCKDSHLDELGQDIDCAPNQAEGCA